MAGTKTAQRWEVRWGTAPWTDRGWLWHTTASGAFLVASLSLRALTAQWPAPCLSMAETQSCPTVGLPEGSR